MSDYRSPPSLSGQFWPRTIVERAPNHDNTKPCFSAWQLNDKTPDESTPANAETRPKWSIQIYDTTPQAGDDEHLRALVKKLHEGTLKERGVEGRNSMDRLDMYGLPLPVHASEEERVSQCIAHQRAEVAARNATGCSDFFIPPTFGDWYDRIILIIDRPEEAWVEGEDGEGFILTEFDRLPRNETGEDPHWANCPREGLGELLWNFRELIQWFYESYVFDGTIDEDLARCRR